jgi:putative N6-adenine-specific DNA methylase
MLDGEHTILATCARGLAPYLAQELRELGYELGEERNTGVVVRGTLADAYRLNIHLRTAFHVLIELKAFECYDAEELYAEVRELPWEELIPVDGYLSVASRVRNDTITNTMFPNMRVKDAVVDRIQDHAGRRPDAGPLRDRVVLTLHWHHERARLYLDTSGTKLSDRGYRRAMGTAPLRETLAAALVLATGYDGSQPLVLPMCGSGTLAIEAALIGAKRPPGLLRGEFCLKHVLEYDAEGWEEQRAEARRANRGAKLAPIVASDHDPRAIDAARANAATAGVEHLIEFEVCDYSHTTIPPGPGILIVNPEYGERLGDEEDLVETYSGLGDFWKQSCGGYVAWLFTGSRALSKKVGLRANRRLTFFNGDIECRLLRYELYSGSKKQRRQSDDAP